jgi:copper chaperone NosL
MSVVDAQFAAQAVTKKGKIYVFDAIECLIPFVQEHQDKGFSHLLVCAYDKPGELIDARTAKYLISENIPSPMSKNLSGYSTEEATKRTQSEKGGTIYEWENLKNKIFK